MPLVGNRILQARALESLVGHARPARRHLRDLLHDGLGAVERRRQSQPVREIHQDLEIGPGLAGRIDRLVRQLDAALGVDECALLFREARAGEHDVGVPRGFRQKQILHGQEFQLLEPVLGVRDIGI